MFWFFSAFSARVVFASLRDGARWIGLGGAAAGVSVTQTDSSLAQRRRGRREGMMWPFSASPRYRAAPDESGFFAAAAGFASWGPV